MGFAKVPSKKCYSVLFNSVYKMWFTEKYTENDKRAAGAKVCILCAQSPEGAEVFLWMITKFPAAQVVKYEQGF